MTTASPSLALEEVSLSNWPFSPLGIAYGQGTRLQLEVLYSEHASTPKPTQLRAAWKARQEGRGVPLLVVVLHDGKAHVCGPAGEDPPVYPVLDAGQVERICQEALNSPLVRLLFGHSATAWVRWKKTDYPAYATRGSLLPTNLRPACLSVRTGAKPRARLNRF